jgi:hypothetical protein
MERDEDLIWERRMQAIQELSQIREDLLKEYGMYQGNLVEEARQERERQVEEAQDRDSFRSSRRGVLDG